MNKKITCEVCGAEIDPKTGSARIKKGTNAAIIKKLKDEIGDLHKELEHRQEMLHAKTEKPERGITGEENDRFGTII